MTKLEPLSGDDDYVRILYVGEYGTAKTTNLASLAHLGRVLYLNVEGGLKKKALDLREIPTENIFPIKPKNYEEIEKLFFKLNRSKGKFAGVVIDSLTDTQHSTMQEIAEGKAAGGRRSGDPFQTSQDDWRRGNEMMRRIVRRYRDLPMHVGVSTLARRDEDVTDTETTVRYGPALTPGIQDDIGGYMDLVCFCRVVEIGGESEYQGIFRRNQKYAAKDRFGVMPKVMINPTFDRVIAYVNGEITAAEDPLQIEARERRKGAKPKKTREAK